MANSQSGNKKMSREEAGRMGGEATAKKHSREFYQEIGRKGGKATAKSHSREFYQEIGRKGGEATSNSHDKDFYRGIGRKGGQKKSGCRTDFSICIPFNRARQAKEPKRLFKRIRLLRSGVFFRAFPLIVKRVVCVFATLLGRVRKLNDVHL